MKDLLKIFVILFCFVVTVNAQDNNTIKSILNVDYIKKDAGNGDGVFIARDKSTKKWGMFQDFGEYYDTLIPTDYYKINFIPFNGNFAIVYRRVNVGTTDLKRTKVGVYLAKWSYGDKAKESVPCKYEDFKKFSAKNRTYLAMKKEGKWGWVDWFTGEEKTEFIYTTPEEIPYPHWEQQTY